MSHDHSTDESSRNSPTGLMNGLLLAVFIEEKGIECLRKIRGEIVRSPSLKSFMILHHGFNGIRSESARNFSLSLFCPGSTGMARTSSAKSV